MNQLINLRWSYRLQRYKCVMEYTIEIMEERNREFYCTLGEFFSSPDVRKELPYLRDDYSKKWFVAFDNDRNVTGVASFQLQKNSIAKLQSAYVFPKYRKNGIYADLVDRRIKMAHEERAHSVQVVTRSQIVIDLLQRKKFKVVIEKSNYKTLELKL